MSKVVDNTEPPFSRKNDGISVPPPKKDILKGVFVIIILILLFIIFITYLIYFSIQLVFNKLYSFILNYIEPSFLNTTNIVFSNIFISSPMFQLVIYSLSRRTTSSKLVISLRPLTCHMPVIPGLIASLARW